MDRGRRTRLKRDREMMRHVAIVGQFVAKDAAICGRMATGKIMTP
jgi:hypothetical protein